MAGEYNERHYNDFPAVLHLYLETFPFIAMLSVITFSCMWLTRPAQHNGIPCERYIWPSAFQLEHNHNEEGKKQHKVNFTN